MNELVWAVPLSSTAPHHAHLIPAQEFSYRLCSRKIVLVYDYALKVNGNYELKCRMCAELLRKFSRDLIVVSVESDLSTSKQVIERRRHLEDGKQRKSVG